MFIFTIRQGLSVAVSWVNISESVAISKEERVAYLLSGDLRKKLIENGKKTAGEWNWNWSLDFLEKVISGEDPRFFTRRICQENMVLRRRWRDVEIL